MSLTQEDKKRIESQRKKIRKHLEKGFGISHPVAERMFNCARLPARIHEIKKITGIQRIYGVMESGYKLYFMECASKHMEAYKNKIKVA